MFLFYVPGICTVCRLEPGVVSRPGQSLLIRCEGARSLMTVKVNRRVVHEKRGREASFFRYSGDLADERFQEIEDFVEIALTRKFVVAHVVDPVTVGRDRVVGLAHIVALRGRK